jgi:hypothetical protein
VIGLELAVEQGEAANLQAGYQRRQSDLRSVACPTDHALAEKGAAQGEPVKPAGQPVPVPAFDRMCETHAVKTNEYLGDGGVDPGFRSISGCCRTQLDNG